MENTRHAEQPERRRAAREKDRQIKRQERQKIDDTPRGQHVFGESAPLGELRVQALCRHETQRIVEREEGDRDLLGEIEERCVLRAHAVERVRKRPDKVHDQHQRADDVVPLVDRIVHHAHRHHFEKAHAYFVPFLSAIGLHRLSPSVRRDLTEYFIISRPPAA